jgi:CRISPR-associated protein (Cas_Cmr3).
MIGIKPFDAIIFGDGKDFNAKERTFRESDFFINPIPILSGLNKASDKKLNIEFLSLAKGENLYFKAPLDIKILKGKDKVLKPTLRELGNVITEETEEPIKYFLDYKTQEKIEDINAYIKDEELIKYLKDEEISINDTISFQKELRTGIKIDESKGTTQEGYLFTQSFLRFDDDVYFYVKASEEIKEVETLVVGGESKLSVVIKKDNDLTYKLLKEKEHIKDMVRNTGFFRLILLTPTNRVLHIEGTKLINKVIGKHITYSSWIKLKDDKTGFPTRIYRLIPEGSVIFYKMEDVAKIDEIFDKYYLKPAYYELEYPYFDTNNPVGFGLSIIGALNLEGGKV